MANKITQLVNKAGDNLYPLAGGIMSDSVTTDMIQDGAVTSSKIDWTTLGVSTTEQVIGQYDNKTLYRKAIVVPANSNTSVSVNTGITIDKLLSVSANMHISTSNDDNWVGTFYGSSTDFFRYFLRKYTTGPTHYLEIRIGSGNATNSPDYIVIVEYTK